MPHQDQGAIESLILFCRKFFQFVKPLLRATVHTYATPAAMIPPCRHGKTVVQEHFGCDWVLMLFAQFLLLLFKIIVTWTMPG